MGRRIFGMATAVTMLLAAASVRADTATMHGKQLTRNGSVIRMTNFDVTLDGRLLTADSGIYHPDTGLVELTGHVRLQFAPGARTFKGEVH